MASQAELEGVALEVIRMLQRLEQLSDVKIAVIGGLAVWHYVAGRPTENINLMMDTTDAAEDIKRKLLLLPGSPFTQPAQVFYYEHGERRIQIDILNRTFGRAIANLVFTKSPYIPSSAKAISEIRDHTVPYISLKDLIVYKLFFCGIRERRSRKEVDAADAEALLEGRRPLNQLIWNEEQRSVLETRISDVVAFGHRAEHWWRVQLNLRRR